ncbi:isochorismate synthase [Candidatus Neptunochlamydia vexilliferae]|uniref:isochorismate synthase n=1 Tax=Candidatus Neptunichlamydia vexilliferae TaxID=1651774 RepID=A0ABS0AWY7_9BACT|nr:isochorismate synthase [Candidatus Neptunochlamydia vexilliferae]MBF5058652.1 hypothetical protein [Candidatus Neptunochlamydia vexilliferae]
MNENFDNHGLEWLKAQPLYPKVYWETPEDGIIAGAGQGGPSDLLFGGQDFMPRRHDTWGNFPSHAYFSPFKVIRETSPTYIDPPPISIKKRTDLPNYETWEQSIKEVLEGPSEKVVLARATRLELENPLCPFSLLASLKGKNRFLFQFSPDSAFIGMSPETLYRRVGFQIESAAIAGTRPLTVDTAELLGSTKDQKEVALVKEMIRTQLTPLCSTLQVGKQEVLKTPSLQHLHYPFSGMVKGEVGDQELLEALHPTPAVGGTPRKEALAEIARLEPFDRGWYAAPVGYLSKERSHHLVAIRSALIQEASITLFAGAGIVPGSHPESEWTELESKIFLNLSTHLL